MAPAKQADPENVSGLCWRIADRFGVPSLALLGMIVVVGYVGKITVEKVFIPLSESVRDNLKAQTEQLGRQSVLLGSIAQQSEDTAEFRVATNEHHRSASILLQAIRDGQVRLEEQNRQLIIEMKTVGDGIRAILGNPTTQAKPLGGTG